jgi:hypothetical protein
MIPGDTALTRTGVNRSLLRDDITTSAPSRRASSAVARPMPEEPPTKNTVLPFNNIAVPLMIPLP